MYTRESDGANHLAHSYKSFKAESSETWARQSVDRSVRKVINHERTRIASLLHCEQFGRNIWIFHWPAGINKIAAKFYIRNHRCGTIFSPRYDRNKDNSLYTRWNLASERAGLYLSRYRRARRNHDASRLEWQKVTDSFLGLSPSFILRLHSLLYRFID